MMGKSGCGKSVMLRAIMRLIPLDGGQIIFDGEDTTYYNEQKMIPIRKKIGMLFQGGALFDSMNVWQNIAYPLLEHTDIPRAEITERIDEMLRFVGMEGSQLKEPSELSGGMKKRIALARAMIMRPKYIFFDEPTTGLDPMTGGMINDLIIRTREEFGVSSIVVTHDVASAVRVGTRYSYMDRGKITHTGDRNTFFSLENEELREFLKDASWQDQF